MRLHIDQEPGFPTTDFTLQVFHLGKSSAIPTKLNFTPDSDEELQSKWLSSLTLKQYTFLLCFHCWEARAWFWTKAIILIWNEKAFKALLTQQYKGTGSVFPRFENVPFFPFYCHLWGRAERTFNANDHWGTLFVKKIPIMHTSSEVSMSRCDSFCQLKHVLYPCSDAEINSKTCWVSIMEAFLTSAVSESSLIVEPLRKSPDKKKKTTQHSVWQRTLYFS